MARSLRVEYPGAFYHVMHRGNSGSRIFKSKGDREKFLEYLSKSVERYELKIHTYCLMTNHYHLLIETPQPNLSQAIKWINVSYASYFNRKQRRIGHLFQGRFKSIIIDEDEYLKHLSRYIHLNPKRAKMVEHLKEYKWSSYPAFSGYVEAPEWLETSWLLTQFGQDQKNATRRYRNFVESIKNNNIEDPSKDVVGGLILGGDDFVNWIKDRFLNKNIDDREKPQLKKLKNKRLPEDLIPHVCNEFRCEYNTILQKGKKRNIARDVAIFLCREMTGESGVALGSYFGGISGSAITIRYNFIAQKILNDGRLLKQINRIRDKIINN